MSSLASPSMPRRLPAGCVEDRDRHGNLRVYYRAKGRPKVRLRGCAMDTGVYGIIRGGEGHRI